MSKCPVDQLQLKYIEISKVFEWELRGNAKLHNIPKISQSIRDNGFRDPPAFDNKLNGGKGGLAFGNGRTEALFSMQRSGEKPPRGILQLDSGEWAVPVIFGVDAMSEAEAKRFSIDHNNLTLACREEIKSTDLALMFDLQMYTDMIKDLAELDVMPLTVSAEDLDHLLQQIDEDSTFSQSEGGVMERSQFSQNLATPGGYSQPESDPEEGSAEQGEAIDSTQPNTLHSDGSMLSLLNISIDDPVSKPQYQDIWQLGKHILVCASVFSQWQMWSPYLKTDDHLFVPYPGIYCVLSEKADKYSLVMVQPNPYIAGHILDAYIQVHGANSVVQLSRKVQP